VKLLFLDIDGVMTSNSLEKTDFRAGKLYPFSNSCIIHLNDILSHNKVKIILTSSWRTVFDVEKQCQVFKENGVQQMPFDATPDFGFENRAMEIKAYLQHTQPDAFAILDDMEIHGFDGHFVHVNPITGLTQEDTVMVNRILNP